jgi:hypothetical protein
MHAMQLLHAMLMLMQLIRTLPQSRAVKAVMPQFQQVRSMQ